MRPHGLLLVFTLTLAGCAAPVAFVERDDQGNKRVEGTLLQSSQEGVWTHYWPNGKKKAEGGYANDVQVGPWTWWYENGQKRCEGAFHAEHSVGRWRYWHPDGKRHMDGFFSAGLKTGRWVVRDRAGVLREVGEYDDGKRTSKWTFFRDAGAVHGWFCRGEMTGAWTYEQKSGAPRQARHTGPPGVEHVVETWSVGGLRRSGFVKGGKRQGRWVTWHDASVGGKVGDVSRVGQTVRVSADFRDGELTGPARAYDPKGRLLAYGEVAKGRSIGSWQVRSGDGFVARVLDETGQPPAVFSGTWSKGAEFDPNAPLVEVEKWLLELASASDPQKYFTPPPPPRDTPAPSPEIVAEVQREAPPPVPKSFLTRREVDGLARWVAAYTRELATDIFATYEEQPKRKDKSASRRLTGVVVDTRLRAPSGKDVDLRTGPKEGWTLLVLMRGFAGQVCPYCPMQLRALAPFRAELERLGVRVVAVYPGPVEGVKGFRAAYEDTFGAGKQPPYEIYYDVDSRLPRKLDLLDVSVKSKVLARPSTFVLDGEGRIRYAYVGRHRADRPAAESLLKKIHELRR